MTAMCVSRTTRCHTKYRHFHTPWPYTRSCSDYAGQSRGVSILWRHARVAPTGRAAELSRNSCRLQFLHTAVRLTRQPARPALQKGKGSLTVANFTNVELNCDKITLTIYYLLKCWITNLRFQVTVSFHIYLHRVVTIAAGPTCISTS
jgi:hypothetical protein